MRAKDLKGHSFGELVETRNVIGTKKFDSLYKQVKSSTTRDDADSESEGSDQLESGLDSDDDEKSDKDTDMPKKKKSKNMPQEISAKRPVTRKRTIIKSSKPKFRDPRFEPLAGELNKGLYERSYGFIKDYQENEVSLLKTELAKEKDPERLQKLQKTLNSLQSKINASKLKESRDKIKRDIRKSEQEKVKKGKSPFFVKKSVLKKEELATKYKSLSESGQLSKFLEKKRKRNAAKEHTRIPKTRRD